MLGDPLRLAERDELCDAVALALAVEVCEAVDDGVRPVVRDCDGDALPDFVPDMESLREGSCECDWVTVGEGEAACVLEWLADFEPVPDAVELVDRVRLELWLRVSVALEVIEGVRERLDVVVLLGVSVGLAVAA